MNFVAKFREELKERLREEDALYDDPNAGTRLFKRLQKHMKRWKPGERKLLEQLLLRRDEKLIAESEANEYRNWLWRHTERKPWTDHSPFGDVDHCDVSFRYCQDPKCRCHQPGFEKPHVAGDY